jgi:hypothetical protein
MFICTTDIETKKELDKKLKMIQEVNVGDKIIWIYNFDKMIYEKFSNKNVFTSNKLFF